MNEKEKQIIEKWIEFFRAGSQEHDLPTAVRLMANGLADDIKKLCSEAHKINLKKQADDFGKVIMQISEAHKKEIEKCSKKYDFLMKCSKNWEDAYAEQKKEIEALKPPRTCYKCKDMLNKWIGSHTSVRIQNMVRKSEGVYGVRYLWMCTPCWDKEQQKAMTESINTLQRKIMDIKYKLIHEDNPDYQDSIDLVDFIEEELKSLKGDGDEG